MSAAEPQQNGPPRFVVDVLTFLRLPGGRHEQQEQAQAAQAAQQAQSAAEQQALLSLGEGLGFPPPGADFWSSPDVAQRVLSAVAGLEAQRSVLARAAAESAASEQAAVATAHELKQTVADLQRAAVAAQRHALEEARKSTEVEQARLRGFATPHTSC